MKFEYKMVQVPPTIKVKEAKHIGNEAAVFLEEKVNEMAAQGWEFYRVDPIGVVTTGGCANANEPQSVKEFYVITFRRDAR